jgi:predicted dehydrogenase
MRCAIVGFGLIAERAHVEALRSVGLDIVAVVEILPQRREAARLVLPDALIYDDVETMLKAERPEIVDVCTPPHLHVEVAEAAARAGAHTMVEKPLATHLADAERLAAAAARHGTVIACVNNWTHAPILSKVQSLAASGTIGRLRDVEIVVERSQPAAAADSDNWRVDPVRAGGGILFDHGWHGMSIIGRVVGTMPTTVRGTMGRQRHLHLSVEDTAEVHVEFGDGTTGRFKATWAGEKRRNRVTVRGDAGSIEVENDLLKLHRGGQVTEHRFAESLADGGYRPGWTAGIARELLDEIAHPVRRGRALDEALTCMRLLVGAYESNARGGVSVSIIPPAPRQAA